MAMAMMQQDRSCTADAARGADADDQGEVIVVGGKYAADAEPEISTTKCQLLEDASIDSSALLSELIWKTRRLKNVGHRGMMAH
jgi:hypothetical protein